MGRERIFTALVTIVVVIGGYFIIKNGTNNQPPEPQSEWRAYTNTKYKYTLQYPQSVYIQPRLEEERLPLEESFSVEMGVRGGVPSVGITIMIWEPYTPESMDNATIEHNRIANLDLKSFAETLRQQEVGIVNPNSPSRNVGALEEINFAGQKAYSITITGYTDGHGSDTFRRIYLDGENYKLILQYSLKGDLSTQIINTFGFTNSSTKAPKGN